MRASNNDDDDLSYNDEDDDDDDGGDGPGRGPPAAGAVAGQHNDVDDVGVDDDMQDNDEHDEAEPPVAGHNNDEDEDQADVPPSTEVDQPLNATTLEAGARDVNQNEPPDGPSLLGTPGVNNAEIAPETPGVSTGEDYKASENSDDEPTIDQITDPVQPIQPEEEKGKEGRYNLRRNRGRNYNHRYAGNDFVTDDDSGIVMTMECAGEVLETPQMSLKTGLRAFGVDGAKAVEKEMKQLHDREVMFPVHKKSLTQEQRKEALAYLMFLKRKRCGKIKGRGCADGRKQRAYIAREDSTAPTVSTEVVFLTAVIDSMEDWDVAVLDVPGAFMQADIDELVHVRFTGEMVKMLLDIDKEMYSQYVVMERGEMVMYMELLKALYGTLCAARLFWQKLSKQLIDAWGFVRNKYDDCVVNKTINGSQMTVVWHVDDLKVSHVDAQEVGKFIRQMEETFGKDTPLSVSRGKTHEYLGMSLDFRNKGEVRISMEHYIDMMLRDAPLEMDGTSNTPAAAHLFKTNQEDPKLLGEEKKKIFVHLVMQGLYLSQRGRPDIRTAISFLCGRLQNPDEDDYKKLTRLI